MFYFLFFSFSQRTCPKTSAMARSKQPPVRRESSSEFFNRRTASWEDADVKDKSVANGKSTATAPKAAPVQDKAESGVLQLVIAVAGIYASL